MCRANRARSPLAAQVLETWAATHGRDTPVVLTSGLYAVPGGSLLGSVGWVLTAHGWQVREHRSRTFRLDEARAARTVVTFERDLLKGILRLDPSLLASCFTLREVVRLTSSPLWQREWNGTAEVAARLHRLRPRVPAGDDETPDPAALRRRAARHVLEEVVADSLAVAPVLLQRSHSEAPAP